MKKLLLFDVDGTLIDYDGTLPESIKKQFLRREKMDILQLLLLGEVEAI